MIPVMPMTKQTHVAAYERNTNLKPSMQADLFSGVSSFNMGRHLKSPRTPGAVAAPKRIDPRTTPPRKEIRTSKHLKT